MKLYLSSYRIPNLDAFINFVGKKPSDIKMGLILNSKDYKPVEERDLKAKELLKYFRNLGFEVEELDLRDYLNDNSSLLKKFSGYDLLWFNGGNTFRLAWTLSEVQGENLLRQALEKGVIYCGDSAGAIVAGPTLRYYEKTDDPSKTEKIIENGLGFINFCVLPHWNSEEYGEALKEIKAKLEDDGYKTLSLTDNEFILIENGKIINPQNV